MYPYSSKLPWDEHDEESASASDEADVFYHASRISQNLQEGQQTADNIRNQSALVSFEMENFGGKTSFGARIKIQTWGLVAIAFIVAISVIVSLNSFQPKFEWPPWFPIEIKFGK